MHVPIEPTVAGVSHRMIRIMSRRTNLNNREDEDDADDPLVAGEHLDAPCEEPLYKTRDYTGGHRGYRGTGPGALERVSQAEAVIAAYHP